MAVLQNRKLTGMPTLLCLDDVPERELRWLWYPYIPIGVATVIAGQGGIGKSTMACNIASAITTGVPLPGQREGGKPQSVLMLSAEDDYGAILRPRLRAAGADLTKIFVPNGKFTLEGKGFEYISEYIRHIGVAIVFIDPLVAWMGGKIDMNRMNEVRSITGKLHDIAEETNTAVVVVHHVRKGTQGQHWEQVAGSGDVVNAARSCLLVARNKMGETFAHHFKHNYSPEGADLYFTFENGSFEWQDGSEAGYDDGERDATTGRTATQRLAAKSFIKSTLKDGPVVAKEVEVLALAAGLNMRTLNRAKKGIAESYAKRVDGKLTWFWRLLPGKEKKDDGAGVPSVADRDDDHDADRRAGVGGAEEPGDGDIVGGGSLPPTGESERPRKGEQTTLIRDFVAETAALLRGEIE